MATRPWLRLPRPVTASRPSVAAASQPPPPVPTPPLVPDRPLLIRPAFKPIAQSKSPPRQDPSAPPPTPPRVVATLPSAPLPLPAAAPSSPSPRPLLPVASPPQSPTPSTFPSPRFSHPVIPPPPSSPPSTKQPVPPSPPPPPAVTAPSVADPFGPVVTYQTFPSIMSSRQKTNTATTPPMRLSPISHIRTSEALKLVPSSISTFPIVKETIGTHLPQQDQSQREIKPAAQFQSPVDLPKLPSTALPPPSPFALPPPIFPDPEETRMAPPEAEKKNGLIHKRFAETHKVHEKGHKKTLPGSDDGRMQVVTVAGENRGAFMEVIGERRIGNIRNGEGNPSKENSLTKEQRRSGITSFDAPERTFTNSNVQGINNSIILNSSCSYHDPGVHLSFSRKPASATGDHFHLHQHNKQNSGGEGGASVKSGNAGVKLL